MEKMNKQKVELEIERIKDIRVEKVKRDFGRLERTDSQFIGEMQKLRERRKTISYITS
jgi:hypothetical protein